MTALVERVVCECCISKMFESYHVRVPAYPSVATLRQANAFLDLERERLRGSDLNVKRGLESTITPGYECWHH